MPEKNVKNPNSTYVGKHARVSTDMAPGKVSSASTLQSEYQKNATESCPTNSKKKKKNKWRVVFWISLCVFVAALVALGVILFSYWQNRDAYDKLQSMVDVPSSDSILDLNTMTVDWSELSKMNPDIVAWIYVPGTPINYPVVQTNDNSTYLTKPFSGTGNFVTAGCIFMECSNKADFSDQNNILYGHHMKDGSMFASIATFSKQEEFDNHRVVYVLTPNGNYRLTSFVLNHVDPTEPIVQTTFSTPAKMVEYINGRMNAAQVKPTGQIPDVSVMNKIFMLCTCDSVGSGRYVLYCYVAESTVPGVEGLEMHNSNTLKTTTLLAGTVQNTMSNS